MFKYFIITVTIVMLISCAKEKTKSNINQNTELLKTQKKIEINLEDDLVEEVKDNSSGFNYFIDPINDSIKVQLIESKVAVLVYPTDEIIDKLKSENNEEDFYTIVDDNNYYIGEMTSFFESKSIKTITAKKRVLKFKGTSKDYYMSLDSNNSKRESISWGIILYNPNQEPILIDTVDPNFEKIKNYFAADLQTNEEQSTSNQFQVDNMSFNIDYIKSKTSLLSNKIDVDNINSESLDSIPNKFIQKYITNRKKVIGDSISLIADYSGAYRFYQHKEFENFNMFTFTYRDESCCTYLYAATTTKDSLSLKDISLIGYTGGDGGWYGEKYGTWINEFGIGNTEVSNFDDDLIEDNNNSEIDTIWSETQLNEQGFFKYIEHHKVKYIGNKQVE